MYPTLDVERAVGAIIVMIVSIKPERSMRSNSKQIYKEMKKVIETSMRTSKKKASTLDF